MAERAGNVRTRVNEHERLRRALDTYDAEVATAPQLPNREGGLAWSDHLSDKEAAEFWFNEWKYARDEWTRGWRAARSLADEVRAVLDGR